MRETSPQKGLQRQADLPPPRCGKNKAGSTKPRLDGHGNRDSAGFPRPSRTAPVHNHSFDETDAREETGNSGTAFPPLFL